VRVVRLFRAKVELALGDVAAPPLLPADFDATLAALIAERGGAAQFSPSQIAAARRLARLLTDEGRVDAPGISVLLTMLPPKPVPEQLDLAKLDRDELCQLGRLIAKATGKPWNEPASGAGAGQHSYHRTDGPGGLESCVCAYCMPRDAEGNVIAKVGATEAT
jgi:hypothetical protein